MYLNTMPFVLIARQYVVCSVTEVVCSVTEVHLYLLSEIGEQGNGVFHNKITSVIKIMKFQIKSATFNIQ